MATEDFEGAEFFCGAKWARSQENPERWAIDSTTRAGIIQRTFLCCVLGSLLLMNGAEFNSNLDLPACFWHLGSRHWMLVEPHSTSSSKQPQTLVLLRG